MTIVSVILAALKIIGAVMNRLDEASKRKIILAANEATRQKVEDAIIDRAVAAFDNAVNNAVNNADDMQHPGRHYRD